MHGGLLPHYFLVISYNLGDRNDNVTDLPETTTQAAVAKEKVSLQTLDFKSVYLNFFQYVTVYVLAINEQSFVDNHLDDLKTKTWKYMTEY